MAIKALAVAIALACVCGPAFAASPTQFSVRASWYGGGEPLATHTSSGERFDPLARTCAHRTLPFGTILRVFFRGRSTVVRVNDRGPAAYTGRSLDLSRAAASDIGLTAPGVAQVTVRVLKGAP